MIIRSVTAAARGAARLATAPIRTAGEAASRGLSVLPLPTGPGTPNVSVATDLDTLSLAASVLLTGRVPQLQVTLHDVVPNVVTFTTFTVDIRDVELDRLLLLRGRAEVRSIGNGTVTADVKPAGIASIVGRAIELSPVKTDAEVREGALWLRTTGLPAVRIPVPNELFPGRPTATLTGSKVQIQTTFDALPPALLRLVNESLRKRSLLRA